MEIHQVLKKQSRWLSGVLVILGFAFAASYSYYTKAAASERGNRVIAVSPGKSAQSAPLVFDLSTQQLPKHWVQPDKVLARYTIKNEGKEPLPVTVVAAQFPGQVLLEAGAATFENPSDRLSRQIDPGKALRVNVSVALTNVAPGQHLLGELQVTDINSGTVLAVTPVHLAGSGARQSDAGSPETHAQHQGGHK